jgi:hypothetical protein
VASSLSTPVRSSGSTMRGINGRGGKPMRSQNLPEAERGRLLRLASRMTALWAATVLVHFPRPGLQFWQGRRALAHGQLRSEHVDEIEQGQQGSTRAEAVFCRFPSPVGREAVEVDHLGCAVSGVLEVRFAWAWRLAAAVAKLKGRWGAAHRHLELGDSWLLFPHQK